MKKLHVKLAALLVSIAILAGLILYANPVRFATLLAASDYRLVLLALAVSTINIFVRVLKWKVLLPGVSLRKIAPIQVIGITISNFSPGKVAEPVKSVLLKMYTGLAVAETLPSVIWERIIDIMVLILLALFGISLLGSLESNLFLIGAAGIVLFIGLVVFGILFLHKERVRSRVFVLLKRLPVLNRLSENFIKTFQKKRISTGNLAASFVLASLAWLLEGVIMYLALRALGVELSPLVLASLFALATIIGVVSALPGGVGSTEIVMVIFLGVLGVDHTVAIAGVLLSRFLAIWYLNFVGGISLVYLTRTGKLDYHAAFR